MDILSAKDAAMLSSIADKLPSSLISSLLHFVLYVYLLFSLVSFILQTYLKPVPG